MERKKDENRRKMEAASGRNDREKGTWKVREREREEGRERRAAMGKSEVTAMVRGGRDAGGEVHQKPDFN